MPFYFLNVFFLSFLAIASLIFGIVNLAGKDIILDDAYLKATKEDREKMDKKAYRLQSAVIFFLLAAISLCNLLRAILHIVWLTYIGYAICIIGVVYAIISHYVLRKKNR